MSEHSYRNLLACGCPELIGPGAPEGEYCDECQQLVRRYTVSVSVPVNNKLEQIEQFAERMPLAKVSWHHSFETDQMTIRVNDEIAYDGKWNRALQDLMDSDLFASLLYAYIKYGEEQ